MNNIERHLEITITIHDDVFDMEIYEPESGESDMMWPQPLSFDEHPEFNEVIGNEIYSWLRIWKEYG